MRVLIVSFGLILYLAVVSAFFYGLGAFVNWQLNPGYWSLDARVVTAMSYAICLLGFLPVTIISLLGWSERHVKT